MDLVIRQLPKLHPKEDLCGKVVDPREKHLPNWPKKIIKDFNEL